MRRNNFIEIVEKNYFGSYESTLYACRGVVIQDGKILLSYEIKKNLWMIPGGRKEDGENDFECVVRELSEDTDYLMKEDR